MLLLTHYLWDGGRNQKVMREGDKKLTLKNPGLQNNDQLKKGDAEKIDALSIIWFKRLEAKKSIFIVGQQHFIVQ